MTTIDDKYLLDLDKLSHPKRHIAEILTGPENAARHFSAALATASAKIQRIMVRPGWGIEAGHDEAELVEAAATAAIAAHQLIAVMGGTVDEAVPAVVEHSRSRLFPLSAVLSLTTGRVLTIPSMICSLLEHMAGRPVPLDSDFAGPVAAVCSHVLLARYPGLNGVEAPPFPKDPGLASKTARPATISMYVERVAAAMPPDSTVEATTGEILVLVDRLAPHELEQLDDGGTHPSE